MTMMMMKKTNKFHILTRTHIWMNQGMNENELPCEFVSDIVITIKLISITEHFLIKVTKIKLDMSHNMRIEWLETWHVTFLHIFMKDVIEKTLQRPNALKSRTKNTHQWINECSIMHKNIITSFVRIISQLRKGRRLFIF